MSRRSGAGEGRIARLPGRQEMLVTVRLFPRIHDALIEELAKASRGLRASRAICLMTVGLTHERGHGVTAQQAMPPVTYHSSAGSLTVEDGAFVAALLDIDQGDSTCAQAQCP
jgi:hypothetical protein